MRLINGHDSLVIVLHEIYGINRHMELACEKYSSRGYDIVCPNIIGRAHPFPYEREQEAYRHFMDNVGFDSAVSRVKELVADIGEGYGKVFVLGYSVGATIAWLCAGEQNLCDGVVGYYGSRIRDYVDNVAKCPVLLFFPEEEKSFSVQRLVGSLERESVNVHVLKGKHGFADPFSVNYCEQSCKEADKLVDGFLAQYRRSGPR